MAVGAPDTAAGGSRRHGVAVATGVALVALALGFVAGSASGVDLDGPRDVGFARGSQRGLEVGSREGRPAGARQGGRAGFDGAYARAYVEAYRRGALSVDRASGQRTLSAAYSKCGRERVPVGRPEICGPR